MRKLNYIVFLLLMFSLKAVWAIDERTAVTGSCKDERTCYSKILLEIQANWLKPPIKISGLIADVRVTLGDDYRVIGATITKTSGKDQFDRSVLSAVNRTAKFEFLDQIDPMLFNSKFRVFNVRFAPDDDL